MRERENVCWQIFGLWLSAQVFNSNRHTVTFILRAASLRWHFHPADAGFLYIFLFDRARVNISNCHCLCQFGEKRPSAKWKAAWWIQTNSDPSPAQNKIATALCQANKICMKVAWGAGSSAAAPTRKDNKYILRPASCRRAHVSFTTGAQVPHE